ncbi:RDD family protein, partial [Myxococcota bacterium]|nr:RDD family protein [Myxococcota bacterium]
GTIGDLDTQAFVQRPDDLFGSTPIVEPRALSESDDPLRAPAAMQSPLRLDSGVPMRTRTEPDGDARALLTPVFSLGEDPSLAPAHELTRAYVPDENPAPVPVPRQMPGVPIVPAFRPEQMRAQTELKPQAAPPRQPDTLHLDLPHVVRRVGAMFVDGLVVGAMAIAPAVLGLVGAPIPLASFLDPDPLSGLLMSGALVVPAIVLAIVVLVSSGVAHAVAGRSLGKLVLGLELVEAKTGAPASRPRALVRAVLSLVSLALFGLGYLWVIVDRRSRALHDVLSGTVVVVSSSRRTSSASDTARPRARK